jgi:hypothetical protein
LLLVGRVPLLLLELLRHGLVRHRDKLLHWRCSWHGAAASDD